MTDIVERLRAHYAKRDLPPWSTIYDAAAEIERLRKDADVALWEATRLLESFVAEHFPSNADWKPQPDLVGVILQLSNAVVIARDYKAEIDMAKKMIERQDKEIKKLRVDAATP